MDDGRRRVLEDLRFVLFGLSRLSIFSIVIVIIVVSLLLLFLYSGWKEKVMKKIKSNN